MSDVLDLSLVGGVCTKSITREARVGNGTWRVVECRGGMLNAIGLANPGIDAFEEHYLARVKGVPCAVIGSVAGFSVEEFAAVAATMDEWGGEGVAGLGAIELNVSCPNVRTGTEFGHSPALVREVLGAVRPVVNRAKLLVKLSPATPEVVAVARAAVEAGADGLTLGNTYPAMAIDVRTRRARLANGTGGLSGPAIHPIAVKIVRDVYVSVAREAGVPIVACGGVMTWEDAAEFVLAGATAVGMGTALFADPRAPLRIVRGLERWAHKQGVYSISELVGALEE